MVDKSVWVGDSGLMYSLSTERCSDRIYRFVKIFPVLWSPVTYAMLFFRRWAVMESREAT